MGWRDEVEELLVKVFPYCFKTVDGQKPLLLRTEFYGERVDTDEYTNIGTSGFKDQIEDVVTRAIKRAYILGHGKGAIAALAQLPESVSSVYEFDPEIDKIWAERAWMTDREEL